VGSFIRIIPGIEEGEPSLCGGAPRAVIPGGILKCRDPAQLYWPKYPGTPLGQVLDNLPRYGF
jgi:hypothetical protein